MRFKAIMRVALSILLLVQLTLTVTAQSSQDIALAKEYAKSMGYSDSDIQNAMSSMGGSSALSSSAQPSVAVEVSEVDRNKMLRDSLDKARIIEEENLIVQDSLQKVEAKRLKEEQENKIYGHEIFKIANLNFVPNYNIPTPSDYRLSAGDEVIIDVWGDVITNITATITPEGYINVPDMGLVYLAGQSVEKAEQGIRSKLSTIYSHLGRDDQKNHVKLSLGKVRSVTVNVVGDVLHPGSYTVPSLSTLAMVMYMSGGPDGIGSVRNINLYRRDKLVSTFDVYEFLYSGVYGKNIRLEDNDVISVAPYYGIVKLEGGVKRRMRYEIKEGESLGAVLGYAGGFSDAAFGGSVLVDRVTAKSNDIQGATAESFVVKSSEFDTFELKGGDKIVVTENFERFANRVNISGAVWREGSYAIGEAENQVSTLSELIDIAGGFRDDAYLKRAYIERYGDARVLEQLTFSPMDVILKGTNVELKADDVVRILSTDDVITKPKVSIAGEVNTPDEYEFRRRMTLGDLILMAGGVTDGATLVNVEIARRKLDVENQIPSDSVATIIKLDLLSDIAAAETELMPYDMVFVRKSINYETQMSVSIEGEVSYPGTYVIESNTVRLSDLIANAGGLSSDAYIYGASLKREVTDEEITAFRLAKNININENDMSYDDVSDAIADHIGRVVIDVRKALDKPGSLSDLVLKKGDVITIPQFDNTVTISGHIMSQNSVVFDDKMSLRDYVSSAGGYQKRAMKRRIYVVQMNGKIAQRGNKNFAITPGSTVIVPEKPEKRSMLQTATVATSFSTMLIAILALFVK